MSLSIADLLSPVDTPVPKSSSTPASPRPATTSAAASIKPRDDPPIPRPLQKQQIKPQSQPQPQPQPQEPRAPQPLAQPAPPAPLGPPPIPKPTWTQLPRPGAVSKEDALSARTLAASLSWSIYNRKRCLSMAVSSTNSTSDDLSSSSKIARMNPADASEAVSTSKKCIPFSIDQPPVLPQQWKPILKLPVERCVNSKSPAVTFVTLNTREINMPPLGFKFSLEEKYELGPALPRSYFNILQQWNLPHTIVFDWPEPDHIFFKEIAGMRKSTYISILEQNSGEFWELHLKPTKERTNILGYLCRGSDIQRDIQSRAEALLRGRKLPLVLDLDDTLVRVVGNEPGRYVSEADAQTVPQRVVQLKDGRRVVLADRVHEFLEWAQRLFEISVCSLGDQSYVDMVVQVLDPHRTRIRGILYSARAEYVHIQGSSNQKRPPKDLLSLFAYCSPPLVRIESDRSLVMPVEPLIVDDNSAMWPPEQRDNIIVVREMKNSPVWNVSLFGVVDNVLSSVYNEFFKQYDVWMQLQKNEDTNSTPPPSVVSCYKEYLRYELSMKIAT